MTLIFLRLKVGHSSELQREGSFGSSTSSSEIAIGLGAIEWSGGGVHKSIEPGSLDFCTRARGGPLGGHIKAIASNACLI